MKELVPVERITSKIYLIRGQKVMLDRDLAELYGVETRVLKQAVKRNLSRFPSDFMFRLSQAEQESLRSQFVTLKRGQHSKYLSFAFTEQGVAMLSSVLKSNRAIPVNIKTTIHGGGDLKLWEGAETPNGGEKSESRITTLMW